jgi:hypothetical protein
MNMPMQRVIAISEVKSSERLDHPDPPIELLNITNKETSALLIAKPAAEAPNTNPMIVKAGRILPLFGIPSPMNIHEIVQINLSLSMNMR